MTSSRHSTDDYQQLILSDTPLLDVRAPIEFQKGCIPGATNIPLMEDEERHLVGIRYKEQGQDSAIELGRELVDPARQAERSQRWADFAKANPTAVLYCFRGGLRSRISQDWIGEMGIDMAYVEGGYKALRRFLIDQLEQSLTELPTVLISGRTGSGKTLLLKRLARHVDLEGLANHRGSSFGATRTRQPTPIDFENQLSKDFLRLRLASPECVFLEDEGKMIGSLGLPEQLREKMVAAPRVVLETPIQERVEVAINDYILALLPQTQSDVERSAAIEQLHTRHQSSLDRIRKRLGNERHQIASEQLAFAVKQHLELGDTSGYGPFIELLLTKYYDPMYDYQMTRREGRELFRGDAKAIEQWAAHYSQENR